MKERVVFELWYGLTLSYDKFKKLLLEYHDCIAEEDFEFYFDQNDYRGREQDHMVKLTKQITGLNCSHLFVKTDTDNKSLLLGFNLTSKSVNSFDITIRRRRKLTEKQKTLLVPFENIINLTSGYSKLPFVDN